ncbi:MAG TPA: hypothetical protein ENJ19_12490 [Gammaproteobacteria bacterium]|nr:hypothetical protein [Gammaproteobacteria bacterium]
MIPCYVSGKGMFATDLTHDFKVRVIECLEASGLGFDTRFRYYQAQFPGLEVAALARKICEPIEYYDRDWPAWRAAHRDEDEETAVTRFFLARDEGFRDRARAAIYCFDEAGFGSGVNVMRFIHGGTPVLGFYHAGAGGRRINIGNVLQLALEYPGRVRLWPYHSLDEVAARVVDWLKHGCRCS